MPKTELTLEQRIEEATARGTRAGNARASWVFDGNTTESTYRETLQGIEDGDPEVLDRLDWSPISGEWAGESIPELLGDLLPDENTRDDDALGAFEAVTEAYEEAATQAYWDAIESTARRHLEA
jgi:hypothetical protein